MTEENKNIDKFFADRLAQNQVEEDWNIPSDDIWLVAKSEFVKEEKPKRRFIFWIFGAIMFGAFIVGAGQFFFGPEMPSDEEGVSQIAKSSIVGNKEVKTVKEQAAEIAPKVDVDLFEADAVYKNANVESKPKNENSRTKKIEKEQQKVQIANKVSTLKRSPSEVLMNVNQVSTRQSKNINSKQSKLTYGNEAVEPSSTVVSVVASESDVPFLSSPLSPNKRERIVIENIKQSEILLESDEAENGLGLIVLPMTIIRNTPKHEVGLSHSEYLFELFLREELYTEDGENIVGLNSSVENVNISHRRWINNKFSYAYGANLSKLTANLDLDVLDTLDRDLSNFVSDKYTIGTRSTIKSEDLEIELIDGFELLEGDVINVKGNVGLSLLAIQFPLMIDYHVYKNRMEYLFGTGVSLDILHLSQNEIDISIFKEQQLVNKPFIQEPYSELILDYSVYASLGAKFHISKKWNVGFSTKISILEPIFSYAEVGIYYRWYK